jgi:hypothetical protein
VRGRRHTQAQNIDSLLDTMANVVGILVVVMAFTQIMVGEAVRRIRIMELSNIEENAAEHEASVIAQRRALQSEHDRLQRTWRSLETGGRGGQDEIEKLTTQLTRLEATPISKQERTVDPAELSRSVKRTQTLIARLESQKKDAKHELAQLQIVLDDKTGAAAVEQVHRVRLPDPRPAPWGTTELSFFVRRGRIVWLDLERLKRLMNDGISSAHRDPRNAGLSMGAILMRHFRNTYVGDGDFRWSMSDREGMGILARLEWQRMNAGETLADLRRPQSRFRERLASTNPRERFLDFHVWSDSYDVYLEARELAEQQGFTVGWKPYEKDEEFEGWLATNVSKDPLRVD